MSQILGLFPTPFMRIETLLGAPLVAALVADIRGRATSVNASSKALSHSAILTPHADPLLADVSALLAPALTDFGVLLFGESLDWSIKEIWANQLRTGGQQALHNHANSFISGVIYLTESHPSANTVFVKGLGGRDFSFTNTNPRAQTGPFNADKWIGPDCAPGDVALFPSYLLHQVPPNLGAERITLAFNAIPSHIESNGYAIGFTN
jgi:uncharacterized protein (TIGR02466 family)